MPGILITYQGIVASDVTWTRTRGYTADRAVVIFPLTSFDDDFNFRPPTTPPNPNLFRPLAPQAPLFDLISGQDQNARLDPPGAMGFVGALVMASTDSSGKNYSVVSQPMYVLRLDTVQSSDDGNVSFVRAILADERFFWSRGFLPRWSFNRARGDGEIAADSIKANGDAYSSLEVARDHVVSRLPLRPALSHAPERWASVKVQHEFPPFGAPLTALVELVQADGLEEPCLRLDGTVALHEPGEGFVGYAINGQGPNTEELPTDMRVSLGGTGQGVVIEPGYPDDYVVVVGGQRVATVAVDDWEPVLTVRDGRFLPLNEHTVRVLTNGTQGMDWLRKFVLRPGAYQSMPGIVDGALELLSAQAFRLWRLPGVVLEPEPGARTIGPNDHLLPLLARAETDGSHRLPIQVETYSYTMIHRATAPDRDLSTLNRANAELSRLRVRIRASAVIAGEPDPFTAVRVTNSQGNTGVQGQISQLTARQILRTTTTLLAESGGLRFVPVSDIQRGMNQARLALRIKESSSQLASQWETAVRARLKASDALGERPGSELLLDLGKQLIAFEQQIEQSKASLAEEAIQALNVFLPLPERLLFETTQQALIADRNEGFRVAISAAIRLTVQRVMALRNQAAITRGQGGETLTPQTIVFPRNLPRTVDTGARVYDARQGVIRTGRLPGHVLFEGVPLVNVPAPTAAGNGFSDCPVRVIFGTLLRPRVDVASGTRGPATGETSPNAQGGFATRVLEQLSLDLKPVGALAECTGGETQIPSILTDRESNYVAAFARAPLGQVDRIPIESVPPEQATMIRRPELVELVGLDEASNRGSLDAKALEIAGGSFRKLDRLVTRKHVLAHPWPVQTDGIVAQVRIRTRKKGGVPVGFLTEITTGSGQPTTPGRNKTRVRRRVLERPDAVQREGLAP